MPKSLSMVSTVGALFLLCACDSSQTGSTTSTGGGGAPTTTSTSASTTSAGGGGAADAAALDAPPAGQGFQFATGDVVVPTGGEEQDCYFFKIADLAAAGGLDPASPVAVHRTEIAQRLGTHQTTIFRVKTIVKLGPDGGAVQKAENGAGACADPSNWADWPLVANSQTDGGVVDWTYPAGVGQTFQPDEWIMLQTHYVDGATQKTPAPGRVRVNFWTMPAAEVTDELGTIRATRDAIRVCSSNPSPRFEGSCQIGAPTPVHVIAANGHMNGRGTAFDMFVWDGVSVTTPADTAKFYASTQWDAPTMLHSPALDQLLPSNAGIWYATSFQWSDPAPPLDCAALDAYDQAKHMPQTLDCCYTAGPLAEQNEEMTAFVYYYPRQDNVNCL